jgi:hypothetical protein
MGYYREALQWAGKLCVGAGVSDEDWLARAEAHRGMAAGEQAMGRGPEAIAEYRLGIADYEKVVARTPKSKPAQRGFSASWGICLNFTTAGTISGNKWMLRSRPCHSSKRNTRPGARAI